MDTETEVNNNSDKKRTFFIVLIFVFAIFFSLIIVSYLYVSNKNNDKKVSQPTEDYEVILPTSVPLIMPTLKVPSIDQINYKEVPTSMPVRRNIDVNTVFHNMNKFSNNIYSVGIPIGWSYKVCDVNYQEVQDNNSNTNILYINDEREDISRLTCDDLSGISSIHPERRHPDEFFIMSFEIIKSDYIGNIKHCESEKKYFGVNNYLGTVIYIGQPLDSSSSPGSCLYTGGTMRTELYYPLTSSKLLISYNPIEKEPKEEVDIQYARKIQSVLDTVNILE